MNRLDDGAFDEAGVWARNYRVRFGDAFAHFDRCTVVGLATFYRAMSTMKDMATGAQSCKGIPRGAAATLFE